MANRKPEGHRVIKCNTCNNTKEVPSYTVGYWCFDCMENGNYMQDMKRRHEEELKSQEQKTQE